MCMDVKKNLNNYKDGSEYIMIQISMIPQDVLEKCNIKETLHNGYIFSRLTKGMYGLPQSGLTAYGALVKYLEPYGYRPSRKTPEL